MDIPPQKKYVCDFIGKRNSKQALLRITGAGYAGRRA
jgi:hypothetical protein